METNSPRYFDELNPTENAVLQSVCAGERIRAIAASSGMLVWTVRNHVFALQRKFHASSIEALIEKARAGTLPAPLPEPAPPTEDPDKRAARLLEKAKAFYDRLGPENPDQICKRPGCPRGVVKYSVFCRKHDFEMIRRQPCPFESDA